MGTEEVLEDLISIILIDKVFARDFHQKVMMRIHRYGAKKVDENHRYFGEQFKAVPLQAKELWH